MRIWLAPSAFAPHRGGVEELTLKIAQHLLAAGEDVLVVTNQHPGSLPASEIVEGVPVRRIPFTAPGRRPRRVLHHLARLRPTRSALDALGPVPDLVHVVCPSTQLPPLHGWCRRHGVPLVITSQGETEMDAGHLYQRSAWMRRHLRTSAASAAALTSCSAWTAEAAGQLAPRFRDSTVIPNGVDPADWIGVPERTDEPVAAAWGRHVPQKGFDLLLAAWPLVRESIPDARLLLGGDGPETPKLRGRAGAGVTLVGSLDRTGVRGLLGSARVAVIPSRIEPFGIVAVEALAAGRGLVYSAGTGLAEAAGDCGRPADVHDPVVLAGAIIAELQNPTPARCGIDHAEELSWVRLSLEYRAVYAGVLG
ncbi:glycosyltransferase family 4 protein [Rhodococcus antarcticus]|uniref:Glycosyltransferase family 4 protein n=1 Tax=Rhodococcus antarcticus TaxID=2987751 RepID=A0ABY6NZW9_9NOCA|nr:glycosyltransferase family 4 protein [Rhodococcus antarcticus]UZJ24955.1 glycosyltransferase family 4 protein [Rhodococcus antarcticus]